LLFQIDTLKKTLNIKRQFKNLKS